MEVALIERSEVIHQTFQRSGSRQKSEKLQVKFGNADVFRYKKVGSDKKALRPVNMKYSEVH